VFTAARHWFLTWATWIHSISYFPKIHSNIIFIFMITLRKKVVFFYGKELLARYPTHKLEEYPLSAVCDCLFNIVPVTSIYGTAVSFIRNPRTHPAVVTRSHIIRGCIQKFPDWVIMKYMLTFGITHCCALQRITAAKLTRLTHKIAI
jgi:hypothetical protein